LKLAVYAVGIERLCCRYRKWWACISEVYSKLIGITVDYYGADVDVVIIIFIFICTRQW